MHRLLISIILIFFCNTLSAQENPFMQMAGKKYAEYSYDLNQIYHTLFLLDTTEIQNVIAQIKEVADKTGSKEWELEAQFVELGLFSAKNRLKGDDSQFAEELRIAVNLLEKAKKENLPHLEARLRFVIIESYWKKIKNYELAFEECAIQYNRLMEISVEDFPEKAHYLLQIANSHYQFKDYPKAIAYYSKILEEKETINNQSSMQPARNGLGLCYRNGYKNYEMSDYYFRAMMQVNYLGADKEYSREIWNAIAEGNLGYNMLQRGEYDSAIPLLKSSFEVMTKRQDYAYASGTAINLSNIYLKEENLSEAKRYIDLARTYNTMMPRDGRMPLIYETLSKYYTQTGNPKLGVAYLDSTLRANKEYEEEFSALLLLRMEQKESAKQQQELNREKEMRKNVQIRLLIISTGFVVILILSFFLFNLYRKKRSAYLGLYRQIKEQDRLADELEEMTKQCEQLSQLVPPAPDVETHNYASLPGNNQQRQLVSRLRDYLLQDNYFATFDINIQELILEMATNRANFFKALKTVTGKTPMEFINDLRLDEAKKLLDNTTLTIETIALECGFNTVRTFYRQFRDKYLITPAEYRNIAKSKHL